MAHTSKRSFSDSQLAKLRLDSLMGSINQWLLIMENGLPDDWSASRMCAQTKQFFPLFYAVHDRVVSFCEASICFHFHD